MILQFYVVKQIWTVLNKQNCIWIALGKKIRFDLFITCNLMCSEVKQFKNIMFNTEGWVLHCIRHRIYTLWESVGQVCIRRSDLLQHSPGFFVENLSLGITLHLLFRLWLCKQKESAICKHDLQIHYNFILDLHQSSTLRKWNKNIINLYICYVNYWEYIIISEKCLNSLNQHSTFLLIKLPWAKWMRRNTAYL